MGKAIRDLIATAKNDNSIIIPKVISVAKQFSHFIYDNEGTLLQYGILSIGKNNVENDDKTLNVDVWSSNKYMHMF